MTAGDEVDMIANSAVDKKPAWMGILFALLLGPWILPPQNAVPGSSNVSEKSMKVFVSIAPQAYFVERVGGDLVDISVMVGPGQSPATYEPKPKQMADLGRANLYFRIGVPFENVWMDRISSANRQMKVVDTRRGMTLLSMKPHSHHNDKGIHGKEQDKKSAGSGMKDPHIWLSLRLAKIQSQNICQALIEEDPAHKDFYQGNLKAFLVELDELDKTISRTFQHLENRRFMVFHPAWGYFAHDYGLQQMPIEIEGKEPSAKSLAHLIEQAKEKGIKVVFVQKHFSTRTAESVAHAIGGQVVKVDPLARDYLDNMKRIADTFAEVLR